MKAKIFFLSLAMSSGVAAECGSQATTAMQLACFDKMAACQSHENREERLACYLAQTSISTTGKTSQSPIADVGPTLAGSAAIEMAFPPPRQNDGSDEEQPVLHSTVAEFKKDPYGLRYLTLANGHVWKELESTRMRYVVGDEISIEKGALGSNLLRIDGKSGMARVKRVK